MLNTAEIDFTIEHAEQIVRVTFPNFSANVGVSINKIGTEEIMSGQELSYFITRIRNESTIPLTDFFWRDTIPTEALRVTRLVTGTFNFDTRYRIIGTPNLGNEIIINDNLSTTRNNVVELRPDHLGLASDEFLIDFSVHFGQVPANFSEVERPQIFFESLRDLPNGMYFANRVDIGGRTGGEWVIGSSSAGTRVFNPQRTPNRIPQSGF